MVGGLASVAGGGKFENGAVTAAFGYMFNAMAGKALGGAGGGLLGGIFGTGLAGLCATLTGGACAPAAPYIVGASAAAGRWGGGIVGSALEDWVMSSQEDGPSVPRYIKKEVKDITDQRITGPDGKMRCEYCDHEVAKTAEGSVRKLNYDHMDAWIRGGGRGADNFAGSCVNCNLSKGQMPFDEWIKKAWGQ